MMNDIVIHTHFNGQFPGKPGLARCTLNSRSPFNFILSNLTGQAKAPHIILDRIPPGLPWASPLPNAPNLHRHTPVHRLTQSPSSFHSTCPNQRNLPLLITKLTCSKPNNSMSSVFFFLSFSVNPHIHLIVLISFV